MKKRHVTILPNEPNDLSNTNIMIQPIFGKTQLMRKLLYGWNVLKGDLGNIISLEYSHSPEYLRNW